MVNRDRVILMTKMSAFRQREGKKSAAINQYFRSDYVGYQVLKSVISATIVYMILIATYVLFHFEELMQNIYNLNLMGMARRLLVYYILLIGVYAIVSYVIYSLRYTKMRGRMKTYYNDLKRLAKLYEKGQQDT
ncbi:MAG: hypothetical protein IJR58_04215 [Lachnospiraceae bacterium]|nr:hypothetical protein [Lachnospiraceae bacterium]